MQIDVRVHAQAPFLHVAVRHVEVAQQQFEFRQKGLGFLGRPQVGVADDFQQRRAGAIQVNPAVGLARHFVMHALARILLQVRRMIRIRRGSNRPCGSRISRYPSRDMGKSYWLIW